CPQSVHDILVTQFARSTESSGNNSRVALRSFSTNPPMLGDICCLSIDYGRLGSGMACQLDAQQAPHAVPPMSPTAPPRTEPISALSPAVSIPSPVFVFPEAAPRIAPPSTPPRSPNATLFMKLPPLRRFTSSKVRSDRGMASAVVGARRMTVSGDSETSLPSTR